MRKPNESPFASSIEHVPFGPPVSSARSAQLEEAQTFDLQHRMTGQTVEVGSSPVLQRSYWDQALYDGYDANGNLLHVVDQYRAARTRHYAYDDLGRLISAGAPSSFSALDFAYDLIGNRTQQAIGPPGNQTVTDYAYVNGDEPVMASYTVTPPGGGPTTYTLQHDTVGNLVDDDISTFGYSPANQMTAQDAASHDPLAFSYDASGLRVASRQGASTTHHFLLPDATPFYELVEQDGVGVVERRSLVYLGDRLLCTFDFNGAVSHVVSDHIAFPLAVYSGGGTVLWEVEALPFGEVSDAAVVHWLATSDGPPRDRHRSISYASASTVLPGPLVTRILTPPQ